MPQETPPARGPLSTPTTLTVAPHARPGWVVLPGGQPTPVPEGWVHVPPGDALLTRKVKTGPHWVVEEKRGPKVFSRGVWAAAERVERAKAATELQRASPDHEKKLAAGRARRAREQADYVIEFTRHVEAFLAFHVRHEAVAHELARRVAEHATPVGSGTVARTERIPVAQRAEAAVIAWMRHQTTAYDHMNIARVKGKRREVRRMLAEGSRALLESYRRGRDTAPDCPLARALSVPAPTPGASPESTRKPSPFVRSRLASRVAPSEPEPEPPEGDPEPAAPAPIAAPPTPRPTPIPLAPPPPRPAIPARPTRARPEEPLSEDDEAARRRSRMEAVRARLRR